MIDPNQILLFIVVVILTTITVLIGWQIFQILSEIRKMLSKFNLVANGAVNMTQNLGKSFQNFHGFSDGLKAVLGVLKVFNRKDSSRGFNPREKKDE